MGNTGLVTLGSLRIQAQQRADLANSGFISVPEWNQLLANSYKELFDLLVTSYGDDYMIAPPYTFLTVGQQQLYPLPDGSTTVDVVTGQTAQGFYKLVGLDLKVTSSPQAWLTMRPFEFTERNKYNQAALYTPAGAPNYRYRVMGNNLWVTPVSTGQNQIQMWYVPRPTNLEVTVPVGTTSSSTTVTCTDTTQLFVGMSVSDLILAQGATSTIPAGATITAISANVSFTVSAAATATTTLLVTCWSDQTTLDGISGWEEYVIVDAAMKAKVKEEKPIDELMAAKAALKQRVEDSAMNRDMSIPARVTDSVSTELGWPYGQTGWDG